MDMSGLRSTWEMTLIDGPDYMGSHGNADDQSAVW